MNMGLILFLSSLLLGTPSDKEPENSSKKNTSEDKINSEIITNQPKSLLCILQRRWNQDIPFFKHNLSRPC